MAKYSISRGTLLALSVLFSMFTLACQGSSDEGSPDGEMSQREAMLARAIELEFDTEYIPPPGDAMAHHA